MKQQEEDFDLITLKDVILNIKDGFIYLFKYKFLIFLIGLIIGGITAYIKMDKPSQYREMLTFMMDESQGGDPLQGFNLFDGLFGKANSTGKTGEKLLKLFESKRIIHDILFDKIEYNGKSDFIANYMLDKYKFEDLVKPYKYFEFFYWKEKWPEELLKEPTFRFSHGKTDEFSNKENQYLRLLYENLSGNTNIGLAPRLISSMDEETGIMSLTMESEDEGLTLAVLNNIYKHLSSFFIEKSVEKQSKTFKIMKEKRDSIVWALKRSEYALADFKDRNRNLVTVKGYLTQTKLERDVMVLNMMYGEAVKQLEITDFSLKNKTPIVQVIDLPRSPIVPSIVSWKKQGIFGFIFGSFLSILILLAIRFFKKVMA